MDIEKRKEYIGGSDCAGVLGLSRWTTPLKIWAVKTGQIVPEDISQKIAVKLGNKLEQTVCELFTEQTGLKVRRVNETLFHKDYNFIGANIDRKIEGQDVILEAKTCSAFKAKEWGEDEIPAEYLLQCYHYLAVRFKDSLAKTEYCRHVRLGTTTSPDAHTAMLAHHPL